MRADIILERRSEVELTFVKVQQDVALLPCTVQLSQRQQTATPI